MNAPAIRVDGLGKRYRIGERVRYKSLRESLSNAVMRTFRGGRRAEETIWALKDVSFEVQPGEVVGVIGRNGAGKSTMLKILSRITEPTEGRVELHGRVGSLLEVGTGFHLELTGRENIYLNGAILGMKRAEIERKFDEIVAFAEIERFLDTPVKHYSTGMYLRLAFAVAAHLEPEILLVDEVLAVGDAEFQKKCLGKMGEVAHTGRTVVFVSHNMGAVARICRRALLMVGGHMAADGPTSAIVARYLAGMQSANPSWLRPKSNPGGDSVVFQQVTTRGVDGEAKSAFLGDERVETEIRYEVRRPLAACQVGVRINNAEGLTILTTADADASGTSALAKRPGTFRATFSIPGNLLAPGRYSLFLSAHTPGRSIYDQVDQTVTFEVMAARSLTSIDNRLGVLAPLLVWNTTEEAE